MTCLAERKILNSWKEISSYLGRGVRTVQRYETVGLPVHRLGSASRSSVIAFADELDGWIRATAMRPTASIAPVGRSDWERLHAELKILRRKLNAAQTNNAVGSLANGENKIQFDNPDSFSTSLSNGSGNSNGSAGKQLSPETLKQILITPNLAERVPRAHNTKTVHKALLRLARQINSPKQILTTLMHVALEICAAGSAGLSILRVDPEGEYFLWEAMAGLYEQYVGGKTPRNFSPCGVTLDRKSPQLFSFPARVFDYFTAQPPIVEGLVVPIFVDGIGIGTIWIVSHDSKRKFDLQDAHTLSCLAAFCGAALSSGLCHDASNRAMATPKGRHSSELSRTSTGASAL
jgi:GAF domain-containing protein